MATVFDFPPCRVTNNSWAPVARITPACQASRSILRTSRAQSAPSIAWASACPMSVGGGMLDHLCPGRGAVMRHDRRLRLGKGVQDSEQGRDVASQQNVIRDGTVMLCRRKLTIDPRPQFDQLPQL